MNITKLAPAYNINLIKNYPQIYQNAIRGFVVGVASRGPVCHPYAIDNVTQFLNVFGQPNSVYEYALFRSVKNILEAGGIPIVYRVPYATDSVRELDFNTDTVTFLSIIQDNDIAKSKRRVHTWKQFSNITFERNNTCPSLQDPEAFEQFTSGKTEIKGKVVTERLELVNINPPNSCLEMDFDSETSIITLNIRPNNEVRSLGVFPVMVGTDCIQAIRENRPDLTDILNFKLLSCNCVTIDLDRKVVSMGVYDSNNQFISAESYQLQKYHAQFKSGADLMYGVFKYFSDHIAPEDVSKFPNSVGVGAVELYFDSEYRLCYKVLEGFWGFLENSSLEMPNLVAVLNNHSGFFSACHYKSTDLPDDYEDYWTRAQFSPVLYYSDEESDGETGESGSDSSSEEPGYKTELFYIAPFDDGGPFNNGQQVVCFQTTADHDGKTCDITVFGQPPIKREIISNGLFKAGEYETWGQLRISLVDYIKNLLATDLTHEDFSAFEYVAFPGISDIFCHNDFQEYGGNVPDSYVGPYYSAIYSAEDPIIQTTHYLSYPSSSIPRLNIRPLIKLLGRVTKVGMDTIGFFDLPEFFTGILHRAAFEAKQSGISIVKHLEQTSPGLKEEIDFSTESGELLDRVLFLFNHQYVDLEKRSLIPWRMLRSNFGLVPPSVETIRAYILNDRNGGREIIPIAGYPAMELFENCHAGRYEDNSASSLINVAEFLIDAFCINTLVNSKINSTFPFQQLLLNPKHTIMKQAHAVRIKRELKKEILKFVREFLYQPNPIDLADRRESSTLATIRQGISKILMDFADNELIDKTGSSISVKSADDGQSVYITCNYAINGALVTITINLTQTSVKIIFEKQIV